MGQFASGGSQFGGFSGTGFAVSTVTFTGGQSLDGTTADKVKFYGVGGAYRFAILTSVNNTLIIENNTGTLYGDIQVANCYPGFDLTGDCGLSAHRFANVKFSSTGGYHNGTRSIHDIDSTGHHSRDTSGNILSELTSTGMAHRNAGVLAGVAYTVKELTNKAAANSVVGYVYQTSTGTDFSVGVVWPQAGTYLVAGAANGQVWVCVGAGGVADGSLEKYTSPRDGDVFFVYCRSAATRGQWALLPEAGTGVAGQVTAGANPIAGRTIGQFLQTTGGAGLVAVTAMRTYA